MSARLRSALIARQDEIGLDDLVAMGRARGLVFDIPNLREAFRHDWALHAHAHPTVPGGLLVTS